MKILISINNQMKKLLLTAVALGAVAISSTAQERVFNNPDNKAYFSIRLAGELTCPGKMSSDGLGIDVFKNGGGVEFGGIYNLPLVANLYLEPGLKLFYNSYSSNDILEFEDTYSDSDDVNFTIGKFGFRIPVMVGYHFDFTDDIKVSVFTGPELEMGLSGKQHWDEDGESVSESIYGEDGYLNRVDLTWGFGAGVSYKKFYLGVSGNIGMLNMLKEADGVTFRENRASLTLGYNF